MKFLTITKSKPIKLSVDTALKAGTPISITGKVANDDTAIGLVANDTAAGTESIAIVTEGMVDVNEIAASYGEALTDDCIAALKGITFLHGGKAVVPAGGGGGELPPQIYLRADLVNYDPVEFELTQASQEEMMNEAQWRYKNPIVLLHLYEGVSSNPTASFRMLWNGDIDSYDPADAGSGEYQSLVKDIANFGLISVRLRRLEDGYAVRFLPLS